MRHGDASHPPRSSTAAFSGCTLMCTSTLRVSCSRRRSLGWGASSVGRALRSQRSGRVFNSRALHQKQLHCSYRLNPRPGDVKGVCPLHGDDTRGLAPFVGVGEAGTERTRRRSAVQLPCPPPNQARSTRSLLIEATGYSLQFLSFIRSDRRLITRSPSSLCRPIDTSK